MTTGGSMRRVAVCLCTCGRAAMLDETLRAIGRANLALTPSAEVLLIVVDNDPDGTAREVCARHAATSPVALHYVEEPRRGIPFARNRAVDEALARGADFIAFLDDDDRPDPDWLAALLERQGETGAQLVFGIWRWPPDHVVPTMLTRVRYFQPPGVRACNRYGLPSWAGTYNVLLDTAMLRAMGEPGEIFRAEFRFSGGEDMDLFIRADRRGFRHAAAPGSVVTRVWEPDRFTLRGVMARAFTRGGSSWRLAKCHLPAARVRRMRRDALACIVGAGARMPLALLGAERVSPSCIRLARAAGVLHAAMDGSFVYYGRDARPGRR